MSQDVLYIDECGLLMEKIENIAEKVAHFSPPSASCILLPCGREVIDTTTESPQPGPGLQEMIGANEHKACTSAALPRIYLPME